ncbi:MAG: response regulator [Proteobacteria bacterium]|nr:response regulator [Pseudomonadota bacterium]
MPNTTAQKLREKICSFSYSSFALIAILTAMLAVLIFAYISFRGVAADNSANLQKSATNISTTILESFDYTNQINNYIGQQITHHGAQDLKFILELFNETNRIRNRNSELFSWSSFDWVDAKNYQVINSKLGIHKNPKDMSGRQYAILSRQHPWTLQVSSTALGNPSQTWVIPAATGVTDKNGKYLGAISIGFDVSELSGRIEKKLDGKTSFVVLDQELKIVLQSVDIKLPRDSDFFQKNFNSEIFSTELGELKKEIEIGDIQLSQYKKISKYPYIILVGFNESFLSRQFNATVLPRLIEFICLAIFFLAILYLFEAEKKLRTSLRELVDSKNKILFSIAHDIKNQIFGISGLANLILDKKTRAEISANEDLKTIEVISDQSEELMEFVKDLLDSNQIERGEFRLGKIRENSVKNLIEEVVLISKSFAKSNRVSLKTNIENNLPKLRCDEHKMKEIFANLINNAIKYSNARSEVLIAAKYLTDSQKICIEITDSGYGMTDQEIIKYLSGDGKEIDKSEIAKKKKIDSYGIGMSIVLKLLELHKGEIKVESKKNLGTKISLFFNPQISFDSGQVSVKNNGKKILLVEDNPVNVKITKRLLEDSGYNVSNAENGQEALEILDRENFDLILMDCEMPILNGYETAKQIRALDKNYRSIPIIALTACDDEKSTKKATDSGMNFIIEKGSSKTNLLKTIEDFLLK